MEQLDTDEKLVENSKDKKKPAISSSYVLIGVICLVVLFAIAFFFKLINSRGSTEGSKTIFFYLFFIL